MNDGTLRDLLGVVGSGPRSAEDLSREQARVAMESILDDDLDPTTFGAFLVANRWKSNTPVELAAFVDVMCERQHVAEPDADPVDCGANYDGKSESALLGVAAGVVAAAAETPVVVHSGDRVPVDEGCAYRHVLDELGVPTDLSPEDSAAMVDATGFGFYYAPQFNPAVTALLDRRRATGVRTFINTVETLANPSGSTVHLGSFYHLAFAERVIETLRESETWTPDRVLMFQGMEGYDDVRPGYTKVAEWDDTLEDYEVETGDYGMTFDAEDLAVDDVAVDSARITEQVLAGERTDHFADAVTLNAALRLYAGSGVDDVEDGVERARKTIADGDAIAVLDSLRRFEPLESVE